MNGSVLTRFQSFQRLFRQGVLDVGRAAQTDDITCAVVALDAFPARVGCPVFFEGRRRLRPSWLEQMRIDSWWFAFQTKTRSSFWLRSLPQSGKPSNILLLLRSITESIKKYRNRTKNTLKTMVCNMFSQDERFHIVKLCFVSHRTN